MKPLICCLFPVLLFSACHQRPASATAAPLAGISDSLAEKSMGIYSGQFSKGLITVVINYISGRTVSGYDIHKGLRRNINGQVTQQGNQLNFVLKEPGNNPFDGIFSFALDTVKWKIKGKWTPIDSAKMAVRQLALSRKTEAETEFAGAWVTGRDSTLTLSDDGTCSFELYERPADSTSQLIRLRGNYVINGKECHIEWEKNDHFTSMRLILERAKLGPDSMWVSPPKLRGNGLELDYFEGD
ncbi:MAG TPA: hypothetical protein VL727_02985 [Puia sp.]|jgi:hypothetical protein|nr:hypothetical protein [Puia sp.]